MLDLYSECTCTEEKISHASTVPLVSECKGSCSIPLKSIFSFKMCSKRLKYETGGISLGECLIAFNYL